MVDKEVMIRNKFPSFFKSGHGCGITVSCSNVLYLSSHQSFSLLVKPQQFNILDTSNI